VTGPAVDHATQTKLYDTIGEKSGLPRILYQVFDSGQSGYPVGIKIVESDDVRTARPLAFEFDILASMGQQICQRAGASKVAFDISRRPPATIELF
jgi:GMP synthase PP-ATPase subunit